MDLMRKILLAKLGEFAPGIPSKTRKRVLPSVKAPEDFQFVEHLHRAKKAGPHTDLRISDGETAFSWAVRKGIPPPGKTHLAIRQPDHDPEYMGFAGEIPEGYGAGEVRIGRSGPIRVLSMGRNKAQLALLDKKNPQELLMIRTPKYGPDHWLLSNVTPTVDSRGEPEGKPRFRESKVADLGRYLNDRNVIFSSKIDGGEVEVQAGKRLEVFSHQPSTSGELINHTYVTGADKLRVPKDFKNSKFRAEVFAVQDGKVLPIQELGRLMNSAPAKAMERMKQRGIRLFVAPWQVIQHKGKRMEAAPYDDHLKVLKDFVKQMPKNWVLPDVAKTTKDKMRLVEQIRAGKHPLTEEGMVAWRKDVAGAPTKIKYKDHYQVYIDEVFPMRRAGKTVDLAGGFTYRLTPSGPVVGRVGTGFDESLRKEMWEERRKLRGRKVVIESMGKFPSGAYRAPSFISFHL